MTEATTTQIPAIKIQSTDELLTAARALAANLHTAFMGGDDLGVWAMTQEMKCLAARAGLVADLEEAEFALINIAKDTAVNQCNGEEHTAQETITRLHALDGERYHLKNRSKDNLSAIRRLEKIAESYRN